MDKIKKFFEKKEKDIKFRNAGAGHKLSDSTKPVAGPSSSASTSTSSASRATVANTSARRTGPDPNVAAAMLARLEGKGTTSKAAPKSTLYDIMEGEMKKASEEMRLKEEQEERQRKEAKLLEEEQKNPFKEFEDSQRFTCTKLDINDSVPFNELIRQIKAKIFDNFSEDPLLRSAMVVFNCNRSITLDNSRLDDCLGILKKVVTNLQTEDPEEFKKYRRIRQSKIEQKVLSLDGALDLLYAIGFTNDKEDLDWLVYEMQKGENVKSRMQFIYELLVNPQTIPIELDRQLKHITEEGSLSHDSNDDLKLTSSDLKQFYNNLEKKREISEMFVSQETKAKLLSNTSNFKPIFTRLRFKFTVLESEVQTVEAVFYSSETLFQVKSWFTSNFGELFGEKDVHFKVGLEQFIGASLERSLAELKLTPGATLLVVAK